MAFSVVLSAGIRGMHVELVHVEADISNGLPVFHMVGYLSSEVKEAAERVRTAIRNADIVLPAKKIMVNLAPATMRKKGASYDLPIALAVLASLGVIPKEELERVLVIGELSLSGHVRKVSGILPIVKQARDAGCHTCILPLANRTEGNLVEGIRMIGVSHLKEVLGYLTHTLEPEVLAGREGKEETDGAAEELTEFLDFAQVRGQQAVKRAAEVAAAGGHNLLLVGPPGSGKSMIARRIPTILPPPTEEESMEITTVYSIRGMVDERHPLITGRPFREVHHTVTRAALIGGGAVPVPGELSLAHGGVLFLDELTEFQKSVLEMLRQPLEERQVIIARSHGSYWFPANVMLTAAMNPCPCGNFPDMGKCSCTPSQIRRYLSRVSQPFLDRMDLCTEAPKIAYDDLKGTVKEESSEEIRERVCRARKIQTRRYAGTRVLSNAMLGSGDLEQYCALDAEGEALMRKAFLALDLTARTYHKILKVARTIADLDGSEHIRAPHLKEAAGYRTMDKKYWGR